MGHVRSQLMLGNALSERPERQRRKVLKPNHYQSGATILPTNTGLQVCNRHPGCDWYTWVIDSNPEP